MQRQNGQQVFEAHQRGAGDESVKERGLRFRDGLGGDLGYQYGYKQLGELQLSELPLSHQPHEQRETGIDDEGVNQ